MNTEQQLRDAVAHLAETAPPPPTWEGLHQRLASADAAPRPRSGPAIILAVIAVTLVGAITVRATSDGTERVDVTSSNTLAPTTASRPPAGSSLGEPPQAIITTGTMTVTLPSRNYCWQGAGLFRCASGPHDPQTLRLRGGARLNLEFTTTEPFTKLSANLLQEPHPGFDLEVDRDGSITIPTGTPPGSYRFIVHGTWSQVNSASYQLTVEVTD
jgi:hypothetical protein